MVNINDNTHISNKQITPAILLPLNSDVINITTAPAIIKNDMMKLHISMLFGFNVPHNPTIGLQAFASPEFYGQGSDSLQRHLQLIS